MKNQKVKFSGKSALIKPLEVGEEVEFVVKGIVSRKYWKPTAKEWVFVVRVFESERTWGDE